ncbi:GlcG/HbpS family heme-binding protein [Novosphingobium sp. 9]|uniref:GlcG/HbpS family heme-binding protein n=1 Tax=Novosphingobium sp. 9 TaxID=2025349 RepID=UPI0021B624F6|nr:heme-binding protein [Novosphingobium sp. 9]
MKSALIAALALTAIPVSAGAAPSATAGTGTGPARTVTRAEISAPGAQAVLDRARTLARQRGLHMCIAVVDASGTLVAFERMDGAITGCGDSAIAKAASSAKFGVPTDTFFTRARDANLPIGFVPGIVPAAGGAPLKQGSVVIGAVGVSGGNVETERDLAADTAAQDNAAQ